MAMMVYGKEESADTLIEQLSKDRGTPRSHCDHYYEDSMVCVRYKSTIDKRQL